MMLLSKLFFAQIVQMATANQLHRGHILISFPYPIVPPYPIPTTYVEN